MQINKSFKSKRNLSIYLFIAKCCGALVHFPAVGRLRQEDKEFEANIGYIVRAYLNKRTNREKTKPRTISALGWTVLQTADPHYHMDMIGWNQAELKMGHIPFPICH